VVPAGDEGGWTHGPFAAVLADGRVYGRGTADMKGGNAAMLFALKMIRAAGLTVAGDLAVQIVPDEETTCMGTLSCVQRGLAADAAFIPEPSGMGVMVAMRGSVYGSITVRGRAGHSEMAQPHWTEGGAVNAISKAAKVVAALDRLAERWRNDPARRHKYTGADFVLPTVIHGGEWEVTYPDRVEVRFGAMVGPGRVNPLGEIEAAMQALCETDEWLAAHPPEIKAGPFFYSAEVAEDEPIVRLGEEALGAVGIEPHLMGIGSLTDAIHLINTAGIPTISIGPSKDTIHAVDEFIEIEQLVKLCKTIALLVMRWCGVEE
jgi:acetylornithine deacetylase